MEPSMIALTSHYSAAASDGKKATEAREAAMLLAVAEGHINDEEDEDALIAAQDALSFFRSAKDTASIADTVAVIIQCYIQQGRLEEAASLAKDEIAACRKAGKKSEEAKVTLAHAEVLARTPKQRDEALTCCKTALDIAGAARNDTLEAKAWLTKAKVLVLKMGKKDDEELLKEAEQAASDALAIFQRTGDQKGEAIALDITASVKSRAGNITEAIEMAQDALDIYQDLDLRKLEAFQLHSLAKWCLENEKPFKAMTYCSESLAIIRELGASRRKEAEVLNTYIDALIAKKQEWVAVYIAQEGLRRFQEAGDAQAEAALQHTLFNCYMKTGQAEAAIATMDKALEACQDAGDRSMEQQLLGDAAKMALEQGKFGAAIEAAGRCLDAVHADSSTATVNSAMKILIDAYLSQGAVVEAVKAAEDMREKLAATGNAKAEANACLLLCKTAIITQNYELAASAAKAAGEIAYQEDDEALEGKALDQLVQIYMDTKKFEKAARAADKSRIIWQGLEDKGREAATMQQLSQAIVSQAYKKLNEGKSGSQVSGLVDKARKAIDDCIELARESGERMVEAHIFCIKSQMHAIVDGDIEHAYWAAKFAVDIFAERGDDNGIAYANVFAAQAELLQEKWERALQKAQMSIGTFQAVGNQEGMAVCQALIDKIEKDMPKPEPVVFQPPSQEEWMAMQAQMMAAQMGGGMQGGDQSWSAVDAMSKGKGKGKGKGKEMQQQSGPSPEEIQAWIASQDQGTSSVAVTRKGGGVGTALDMANLTEDAVAAKAKEVALAIVGDTDEEMDLDTPLMEAGLTSSTAVVLKDELEAELPGITLPPTLIFDYPSVGAIAEYVMEKIAAKAAKAKK